MELSTVWFVLIAVLWSGYFVLEGFDFGVGALFPVLGRDRGGLDGQTRRRVMLSTIGPVWDGNEVWLITAGGAMFAAFPHWYATMFSGFYIPLFLILVALIVRALGFDYRGKIDDPVWRRRWDRCIFWGSVVPAVLWGVLFTNIVRGVPINDEMEYTGGFLDLFNPVALLGGLMMLGLFVTHGAMFLALKTDGAVRADARTVAVRSGLMSIVLAAAWLGILQAHTGSLSSYILAGAAALFLIVSVPLARRGFEGLAFTGTLATIALAVASLFVAIFPDVMPSSSHPAYSLTVHNASSTDYTLTVMSWIAAIFIPVVLLYTAFTYWTFRRRVSGHHIPTDASQQNDSLTAER